MIVCFYTDYVPLMLWLEEKEEGGEEEKEAKMKKIYN
jgi:hypothetical protein